MLSLQSFKQSIPDMEEAGVGVRSQYSDKTTGWEIRCSKPGSGKGLITLQKQRSSPQPTYPRVRWVKAGCFCGVKRSGRKANHSTPSSPELKNDWSCNFMACIGTHLLERQGAKFLTVQHMTQIAGTVFYRVVCLPCHFIRVPSRSGFHNLQY